MPEIDLISVIFETFCGKVSEIAEEEKEIGKKEIFKFLGNENQLVIT
jgi:hypothetical protein